MFARIEAEGQTVAVGVLGPDTGWAGIHGMRTAQRWRGKGLATRILATLAGAALEHGFERLFLQVEVDKPPCRETVSPRRVHDGMDVPLLVVRPAGLIAG